MIRPSVSGMQRWGELMQLRASRLLIAVLACAALSVLGAQPAAAQSAFGRNPVLFVHGIEGSGSQFESQKMRFLSNGYPEAWVDELDYDSSRAVGDKSEVDAQIDAKVAALKQRTGKAKVDVIAHSLGTSVMYDYLTNGSMAEQRKASIGKYVNVDGQNSNPGVPTLALWAGRGTPGRSMDGATNVTIPDQTHVQTCTSAQSFVEYFKFLTGAPPAHDIVPQKGAIELAGRALNFPQNNGLSGAKVELWEVDGDGKRVGDKPVESSTTADSGNFGPYKAVAGKRYEFALVRSGFPTHHLYYEPFLRSDYAIRLLESDAITAYTGNRAGASSAVIIRYKELWGDQPGETDVLKIDGTSVCTPEVCPISHQVNALFAFDQNRNGQSDLTSDPALSNLPFIGSVDVFVAGSSPPNATTTVELTSRGKGPARTVKIPNWESTNDSVTVQLNDFESPLAAPPPAASCPKRQRLTFRIPQPRGARIVQVTAFVDGKRVKRVRGHRIARLRLKPPVGKTNFTVRIVKVASNGRRSISVRKYRRCHKTRPSTHTQRGR
jgi:pimeloyl-ACP methyl ester carboxylesterase